LCRTGARASSSSAAISVPVLVLLLACKGSTFGIAGGTSPGKRTPALHQWSTYPSSHGPRINLYRGKISPP
jgi:hypothetical protein